MPFVKSMDFSFSDEDVSRQIKREKLKRNLVRAGYNQGTSPVTPKAKRTRKAPAPKDSPAPSEPSPTTRTPSSAIIDANDTNLITIGTDCVGLGAELYALAELGLQHRVVTAFASELDENTRRTYVLNHPNCSDMFTTCCTDARNIQLLPSVDLYSAGPPCTAFSLQGKRKGLQDHGGLL